MGKIWVLWAVLISFVLLISLPLATADEEATEELREEIDELYERLEALEKEKDVDTGWANWAVTGFADLGYRDARTGAGDDQGSFTFGSFSPIFLFQMKENILFEGELEFEFEDGATEVNLEYAQVDWLIHDNVTLVFGKFLSPFNIFFERLHPPWINKLPTMPVMFAHHGGFMPNQDLGAQVRGGVNLGDKSKVEYAFFLTNGPSLLTSGHDAGGLEFGSNISDNNDNKAVGFRLSVLPIPHLELGASYMHAAVDDRSKDDANFIGVFTSAQYKNFDFKFEWAKVNQHLSLASIRTFTSTEPGETDAEFQDEFLEEFNNTGASPLKRDGFYIQGAYRFADIPFPVLPNILARMEIAARYEETDLPGTVDDQEAFTIGLNYWLKPNMVFKVAYEFSKEEPEINDDVFLFQVAYGF
jgi:hypothetical protein